MKKVKTSYVSKISSKGQITLPVVVRDALRVKSGDVVVYSIEDDGAVVLTSSKYSLDDVYGILPPLEKLLTVEEMVKIAKDYKSSKETQ
ncbi:hypothetical protein CO058_02580 [candidate division WWE3 bacterium CG_4_9_14_0_2_um_filter_35_11]|uniref:SpoVT-AbrB domain-containing protein n=1 Tax=candidate division WWE3 bacterium CG_4_9_14_0_2_um_filter_35_11 TaxID=1975077 RepID=A0A2M8ELL6_UNCKA|nr:MAG: hypothetical protein COV25_02840 [candidate division WWE3 bacterium CG10_big_fil_rev_8_21_14_0_10_35_32]PJC23621.1 MAG: hypothetical protein CO058_02580 [candidate division WWE3 bacterium CG_4_9_14_0_2_um_filter_35_11]